MSVRSDQVADRIDYTEAFKENVQGRLKAKFRVDSDGTPVFEPYDGDPRLRLYMIDLFLATPQTRDINGVKYYLDDSSYLDPEGYSDDADNYFREGITSYGDVEIVVTVEMSNQKKYEQRAWLSNMLENGYADDMTPAIRAAIQRIKVN